VTTSVDAVPGIHGGAGQARAGALVAACTLAMLVDVGAAQEDLVHVDGRVLWIAGQTMVVAPYAIGSGSINIDLAQASQDEYMRLTTGDSVTVTGTIAQEGNRVFATSSCATSSIAGSCHHRRHGAVRRNQPSPDPNPGSCQPSEANDRRRGRPTGDETHRSWRRADLDGARGMEPR